MFNIIPLKDVLLNLNGTEELCQLFECMNPLKRDTLSQKGSKEKSSAVVRDIFVLQSHVLVLVGDLQLIAFDQTPIVAPNNAYGKDLLSCSTHKITSVLDVFVDNNLLEYVFIISKSGELIVWTFRRPSYKWQMEATILLCKKKGSQLLSYTYDNQNKVLVWCEKITASQCCIYSTEFNFTDNFSVKSTQQILYNCLPMSIHFLAQSNFCFISYILPSLMLFWCSSSGKMTVRMWGDFFNTKFLPVFTTDYQSIIKGCISLWIDSPSSEIKFIAVASHSITKELIVLQHDLQVSIVAVKELEIISSHLCTLETTETEIFAQQVTGIYLINHLLLVLMSDGKINVFDTKYGLFLWKTESYVSTLPKLWVRKGEFPAIGIWNNAGIWVLYAKSVVEQLKEAKTKQETKSPVAQNVGQTAIIDGCLLRRKVDIYKGISRNARTPLHYAFEILDSWNLSKHSTELALKEALKIKELTKDDISAFNTSDILCLVNQINDPVLLLILFCDGDFCYLIKKEVVCRLFKLLKLMEFDVIDKEYSILFKEYLMLEEKIKSSLSTYEFCETLLDDESIFRKEFQNLLTLSNSELEASCDLQNSIEKCLCFLFELNQKLFVKLFISLIPLQSTMQTFEFSYILENCNDLFDLLFKALIRVESSIFYMFWTAVWDESPMILSSLFNDIFSKHPDMEKPIIAKFLSIICLPDSNDDSNVLVDQVQVYCLLLLRLSPENDDKACDIFLKYSLIEDAISILMKNNNNSLKHKSLFYRLLFYTLKNKQFKSFVQYFSICIPENFNIGTFNSICMASGCDSVTESVFTKNPNDIDISSVTDFFSNLLQRDSKFSD
ncbi:uncharacterized protein LOC101239109 [Hydra vulgaris]|uniref:uncharacterized protein LOC101239109 n=1 Tax=Hydra vulgaris TaxID=6087 RepID=UPI001F5F8040|nr:uncharacterized protein LOC101239109 isoform X1 [Hydra vulgaris]XP_047143685.1 uncharacterized protein LOC101239109 isoform X1 [Hydra vulgaris]